MEDEQPIPVGFLDIFPLELWEMILDRVEDQQDIEMVFKAIPEFATLFHWKKATWSIDEVFPYIFKQWNRENREANLLSCRQVCRRWCKTVDTFLQTHPSVHPYNSSGINRRTVQHGEFSFANERVLLFRRTSSEGIRQCHDLFQGHPKNPFIAGRVCLVRDASPQKVFLKAVQAFLEKFGLYILDLSLFFRSFHIRNVQDVQRILNQIRKCLSFIPNIKSLTIQMEWDNQVVLDQLAVNGQLQKLPSLESLQIYSGSGFRINESIVNSFVQNGGTVRKLELPYSCLERCQFATLNVHELCLDIHRVDYDGNVMKMSLLNRKYCPLLKKLKLCGFDNVRLDMNDILARLASLSIEEFEIDECDVVLDEKVVLSPIPSMKYFRIYDTLNHNFDFVRVFTCLQHFQVDRHRDIEKITVLVGDVDENAEGTRMTGFVCMDMDKIRSSCENLSNFSDKVRMYMYANQKDLDDLNIWNELPNLKMLSVSGFLRFVVLQYARECGNKGFILEESYGTL